MRHISVIAGALCAAWLCLSASRPDEIPFTRHTIDLGFSETCAVADVNRDGKPDIISGENWFEGPAWKAHRFRRLPFSNQYLDNFTDLALDVNSDGYPDLISGSYFSRRLVWLENPRTSDGVWKEREIDTGASVEFVFLVDINNDGEARELLPQFGQANAPLSWYELRGGSFTKHVISPTSYGHGIGAGDVNGDKRTDVITPKGWFEAPADPKSGDWRWHAGPELGAVGFVHVVDVNGDHRPDMVTSMAHDYGVFWMERTADGSWRKHVIDDSWSQAHALSRFDLNADGRPDFVTGKRLLAHNGKDPGERDSMGVYWYEFLPPEPDGKVEWVKHIVDYGGRAGGGMQIPVVDVDADKDPDFVVAGKGGLFLFENLTIKR
jgi:hypothetical protein